MGGHPAGAEAGTSPTARLPEDTTIKDGRNGDDQVGAAAASRGGTGQRTGSDDELVSGERADYAPQGADPKATTGGTLKRTLREFSEDAGQSWPGVKAPG
jgi:membrane protein